MPVDFNKFRNTGDLPADDFVNFYFTDSHRKKELDQALQKLKINKDWAYFLTQIPEAEWFDQEIEKITAIPASIQLQAVRFFKKKEQYILQLLGLLSLPYCYAAADGAKVLFQTERMYKDVAKRLEETALFVAEMMKETAFEPVGAAKVQLFKVRVMHAAARLYLKKGDWDLNFGQPVNQEDMAGTNLSFSLIVIRGLRTMGFNISYNEQMSYIKYWSWIGAMLGVNPELLPENGKQAHDLEYSISQRQFKSSPEGTQLTRSLLQCFYQLNDGKEIKNEEISGFMRFLLGNKVADILDLPLANFPISKQILLKLKVSVI
jgi:hypothetical protein